jgi:uncharacterized protein YndB with AHSA1/START domain
MKHFIVKKKITLDATPEEVWDALTNPQKTKKYFFNCEVISKWKEGSPISFKGRVFLFFKIELKGTILEIEPKKLLKYNLKNKNKKHAPESYSTITDVLSYKNEKTTLSITDDVGIGEGAEKRFKRSDKGWDKVLHGLDKFLRKGK